LGIIAASLVEIHLTKLIKEAFVSDDKVQNEVFSGANGPLGSFSAKNRLAYLMGLISEALFRDLETMRHIRNRFAHQTAIGRFDHPEISSRCFNFTLVDKYVVDPDGSVNGDPAALFGLQSPGAAPPPRKLATARRK
jgi:DNA-binding MltR family transcriptional regulator